MTVQAYLDTIRAKTGKGPDDFRKLAADGGLTRYSDILAWLKQEIGLGHGHANLIAQLIANKDKLPASQDDKLDALFTGEKARWWTPFEALAGHLRAFGGDVAVVANQSYVNLLKNGKKFGIVQISSALAIDIGIKAPSLETGDRLTASGKWNAMVTHRVTIREPAQIDLQLIAWLRQAYDET